ncbi:MAG: hypothetical protein ACREQB_05170 [Candidatus Binataceae bacterium]
MAGCFYPPQNQPPTPDKTSVVVQLPYDLAWNTVNAIVKENDLKVNASNPNHGIIEAAGRRFTLHDADCGRISSIAGSYPVEPELGASTVYNFKVEPSGNDATRVVVRATFSSSLRVPLQPYGAVECISRGTSESRLLREVLAAVRSAKTPEAQGKRPPLPKVSEAPLTPGRPTLLRKPPPLSQD